ncbi:MAG: V-type ATPase subunit [candidate division WOR-3 bacterium]|nr:V-type ATPase subunit [candidate division WOR-3 bacterium]MDW8150958.1 V-type ATPase subunit [candidate division WOR-3 bacterium]
MIFEYVNTRVLYRSSKLLPTEVFKEVLGYSNLSELINYLRGTWYNEYISKVKKEDLDSFLEVLKNAFSYEIERIVRFSGKDIGRILKIYLSRWDLYNILTIIRGKFSKFSNSEILEGIMPFGSISRERIKELLNTNEPYEVLDKLASMGIKLPFEINTQLNKFLREGDLRSAEFYLYNEFYRKMSYLVSSMEGLEPLRIILGMHIDLRNIVSILILISEGISPSNKMEFIGGGNLSRDELSKLASAESYNDALNVLRETPYGEVIKNEREIVKIERKIENYIYNYTYRLKNTNFLDIGPILSYIARLEVEIMNLRIVAISIEREVPRHEAENYLIWLV